MPGASIVFGRVPGQNIVALRERMHDFVKVLERAIGREIRLRVPATYDRVLEEMLAGGLDFVVIGPELWLQALDAGAEYELVARPLRNGARSYRSEFVCLVDSDIKELQDLRHRSIALVNKQSVGGYIAPLATLRSEGISLDALGYRRFLGSHENVLRAVADGRFDAGVTFEGARRTLSRAGADFEGPLRVFARSDPVPNEPLAFSKSFLRSSPQIAEQLKEAILTIHQNPAGAASLGTMREGIQRFEPVHDPREYDAVRRLLFADRPRISHLPGMSLTRLILDDLDEADLDPDSDPDSDR